MSFSYNRSGDVIEIVVRDATFKKIENHKFNSSDTKVANKILGYIEKKYGFKPEIAPDDSINAQNDTDDFLNMKLDW
jgi:hypothetical protein